MYTNNANHPVGLPLKNGKNVRVSPGESTDADIDLDNDTVKKWLDAGLISKGGKARKSGGKETEPVNSAPGKPYAAANKKFGDWHVLDKDGKPYADQDGKEIIFPSKDGEAEAKAKAYANRLNLS